MAWVHTGLRSASLRAGSEPVPSCRSRLQACRGPREGFRQSGLAEGGGSDGRKLPPTRIAGRPTAGAVAYCDRCKAEAAADAAGHFATGAAIASAPGTAERAERAECPGRAGPAWGECGAQGSIRVHSAAGIGPRS